MYGKLLGAFFGFLFGNILGAAIGLFLGHQFDKARRLQQAGFQTGGFTGGPNQEEKQQQFFISAFAVMGHVAKAKGKVTQQEIQLATLMMDRMNLHGEQRKAAQDAFRDGKSADFPLEKTLEKVRISSGGRFDLMQFFLELQISAAFADGDLHTTEREVLHRVAKGLGFSPKQLEKRLKMQEAAFRFQQGQQQHSQHQYRGQQGFGGQNTNSASDIDSAYEVLGVSKDVDAKSLKRAYRKLMNEHHPDKLMAKGLPPEMMNVAKEKAQDIQNAYELIKKVKQF